MATNEDAKKLVIARIQTMPSTMRLSINGCSFGRRDLIAHVQKDDAVGQKIIEIHLNYLRAIAKYGGSLATLS